MINYLKKKKGKQASILTFNSNHWIYQGFNILISKLGSLNLDTPSFIQECGQIILIYSHNISYLEAIIIQHALSSMYLDTWVKQTLSLNFIWINFSKVYSPFFLYEKGNVL